MRPSELVEILKSPNDKREYRYVKLENDLKVLLVSDCETDKAAAAMDVHVGSFSDPEELPGLAHFLEHMLFFSSEKYPSEGEYVKFLSEHGGSANAYTGSENTNFQFDVNFDSLSEALDRFAQFFICPLMSADATMREINAVDSENKKNYTADVWRFDQLHRRVSSKDHPYHKFGTGNLETLHERPTAKGIDTRKELISFYERYYSANQMCLTIYGRESLDELQALAEDKFSAITNKKCADIQFAGVPWLPEHVKILIKAVPVKEGHSMEMLWPIPPVRQLYKKAPDRYLSHLLGHEGEGSIFALLKKLGWANSLSCGVRENYNSFAIFSLNIELTDDGYGHVDEIVSFVFQYISIVKAEGVQAWMFDENKALAEMRFQFRDKRSPFGEVMNLSSEMKRLEPRDWVAGGLPEVYDPELIHSLLECFTPTNTRLLLCSKKTEGESNEVEPFYGTKYCVSPFTTSSLDAWTAKTVVDPRLHLPPKNIFIPTDFSIKAPQELKVDYPVLLRTTPLSRLWYKPDTAFQTPKACIVVEIALPLAYGSPEASVLSHILSSLISDSLNELAYDATLAGLLYNVSHHTSGFKLFVSGYNHKILALLTEIIDKIVNFEVKEDRFDVYKETLTKDLTNFRYRPPFQQAYYSLQWTLEHRLWHFTEKLHAITALTVADMRTFVTSALSRMFLEAYIAGNMSASEAEGVMEMMEAKVQAGATVKAQPISDAQQPERRIVHLYPRTNACIPLDSLNPDDANHSIVIYLQVSKGDLAQSMAAELLVQTARTAAFHQLRTVEQLGYIVNLSARSDADVQGIVFIIQSSIKAPEALDDRVEAFIQKMGETLETMTDNEFETHVDAVVGLKEERLKSLREETFRFWPEIENGTLMFDRVPVEVAALRKTTKEDLVQFYKDFVHADGPHRRKLAIWVVASSSAIITSQVPAAPNGSQEASDSSAGNPPSTSGQSNNNNNNKGPGATPPSDNSVNGIHVAPAPAPRVHIHNVAAFKRSQMLFPSAKIGPQLEHSRWAGTKDTQTCL